MDETTTLLRGPAGSSVDLTVAPRAPGAGPRALTLERRPLPQPPVVVGGLCLCVCLCAPVCVCGGVSLALHAQYTPHTRPHTRLALLAPTIPPPILTPNPCGTRACRCRAAAI